MEHDKFCIKWTPHRAATSYRIKLNPVDRESSAPAAVAALASGCRATVSLSLSRQTLIGDDVDTTHHLSAALLFIPAHMEEIKNIDCSLGRDQLWAWLQLVSGEAGSRICLVDAHTRPSGDGLVLDGVINRWHGSRSSLMSQNFPVNPNIPKDGACLSESVCASSYSVDLLIAGRLCLFC